MRLVMYWGPVCFRLHRTKFWRPGFFHPCVWYTSCDKYRLSLPLGSVIRPLHRQAASVVIGEGLEVIRQLLCAFRFTRNELHDTSWTFLWTWHVTRVCQLKETISFLASSLNMVSKHFNVNVNWNTLNFRYPF